MYKTIADTKNEAFDVSLNRKIRHISEASRIDRYPTNFLGRGDVSFSEYKKSIEFSDELSKRTFW